MDRRDLVKILGMGLVMGPDGLLAHDHMAGAAPAVDVSAYRPRFLTAKDYQVLGRLCDIIIPGDEQSPGARQAGVPFYIDSVLFHAKADEQNAWRAGMDQVRRSASAQFGRPAEECSGAELEQLVAAMAVDEKVEEAFFARVKGITVEAYWLSEAGMREYLSYRGDVAVAQFPGCTHPEHQQP